MDLEEMAGKHLQMWMLQRTSSCAGIRRKRMNPEAYVRTDCKCWVFPLELLKSKWYVCADCIENNVPLKADGMIPAENRDGMSINELANSGAFQNRDIA